MSTPEVTPVNTGDHTEEEMVPSTVARTTISDDSDVSFHPRHRSTGHITITRDVTPDSPRITMDAADPFRYFDIGKFTGRDGEVARAFLKRFEKLAQKMKWDNDTKALVFAGKLRGQASTWYAKLPDDVAFDWDKLTQEFTVEYSGKKPGATPVYQFNECKQGTLSVRSYAEKFRAICTSHDLDLNDQFVKDFFVCGLRQELQAFVRINADKSLLTLIQYAAEIEPHIRSSNAQPRQRSEVSPRMTPLPPDPVRNPRATDGSPICRKCNRAGHIAKYCRASTPATTNAPAALPTIQLTHAPSPSQMTARGGPRPHPN